MTTTASDPLIELQFRLLSHTYKAVKRAAEELGKEGRKAYLLGILGEWERSEARSPQGAVRKAT
jgi:hypothetical protein